MIKAIVLSLALILAGTAASGANYIEPEELKALLEAKKPVILVDIQPAAEYGKHHLPGSIETNAFPAKSAEEKARLDKTFPLLRGSTAPVVVVCPRGKSGAKNSYEYLVSHGIKENRMQILEGGMAEWPYPELMVKPR